MKNTWQPSTSIKILKKRAALIQKIRAFFIERNILEVETPLLCSSTVPDPHIESFCVDGRYLQTSPEFAMKRLLAAGSGDIFQICKAFRHEEAGRMHNPEFTILEWYRVGYDHLKLMDEMDTFLQTILNCAPADKITYQKLFEQHLSINPHTATCEDLNAIAKKHDLTIQLDDKDDWLNLLLSHLIEPHIGQTNPIMIYDYPASQSALAKIRQGNPPLAERFEVYYKGFELANGFHELNDQHTQQARFEKELQIRQSKTLHCPPLDKRFLESINHMPDCAGVAVGVDRLVMLACHADDIQSVLSFDYSTA